MNEEIAKRIAVFASGTGSNFEALHEACVSGRIRVSGRAGTVPARIVLLVCDRPGAPVVGKAARAGIPVLEADPADYPSKDDYELAVLERLAPEAPDVICLAGYMRIVGPRLLEAYEGRILNIHPSLLPSFPGAHAMRDALACGVKVFGPTVHLVNAALDGGPIVAQQAFEYLFDDPAELEALMHEAEHRLYPRAVNMILARLAAQEEALRLEAEAERRRQEDLEREAVWSAAAHRMPARRAKKRNNDN